MKLSIWEPFVFYCCLSIWEPFIWLFSSKPNCEASCSPTSTCSWLLWFASFNSRSSFWISVPFLFWLSFCSLSYNYIPATATTTRTMQTNQNWGVPIAALFKCDNWLGILSSTSYGKVSDRDGLFEIVFSDIVVYFWFYDRSECGVFKRCRCSQFLCTRVWQLPTYNTEVLNLKEKCMWREVLWKKTCHDWVQYITRRAK